MSRFLPRFKIRSAVLLCVSAATLTGCLAPGARDDAADLAARSQGSDLVPTFTPREQTSPSTPAAPTPSAPPGRTTTEEDDGEDGPTSAPTEEETPEPSPPGSEAPPPQTRSSSVEDPDGDVTSPPLEEPPPYADLLGARVELTGRSFEVAVTLGGQAPEQQPDPDHTMNVAWFVDIDGDGVVDHEIWLNLADNGWFPGHRDNRQREARFGDKTGIDVSTDGRDLVFRFSKDLLGAEAFRWATASEWGRYEVLGTDAAARDSAPDDHGAVQFPG